MQRLFKAAVRRRIATATVQRAVDAYAAFEELVRRHAGESSKQGRGGGRRVGGRAVFDTLINNAQENGVPAQDIAHRRATFKGNSYLWGIQTQTTLSCSVIHKGEVDSLVIRGFAGLSALRKNAPFRLMLRSGAFQTADPKASPGPFLSPGATRLLDHYSSHPLPAFHVSRAEAGPQEISLRFDNVGKASAVNLFTAGVFRSPGDRSPEDWHGTMKFVELPTESLILDVLVPHGWTNPATVRTTTHGNPALFESLLGRLAEFEMPIKEKAEHLGTDLQSLATADLPTYPKMVQEVLSELGWHDTAFDIYRCCVRYPLLHSLVHLRVDTAKP